ncbi:hypothetical protein JR316_0013105 [Psilocybe cubensis]|uniref:Uncharacterized protein n=2 Tax=Psilocybe cubensis TaxID=181762 RepID=A0ACB8GHF9_PSICU|nr:hypothetical protein JR316_0013105 [Psilocybe cubensis]KAH9474641.1 hypothetical protein JR316_0013105 [Psilocybe cubensis]
MVDSSASPPAPENTKSRVPIWIPVSAFIGTSLALAIPLFMLRRQRTGKLNRLPLKGSTAPPPRRATGTAAALPVTTAPSPQNTTVVHESIKEALNADGPSLSSALAQMNASSGLLAAKAFAIATGLVAVGGFGMVWMVKTTLGVSDAREFGHRARTLIRLIAPSLTSRIHRASEEDAARGDPPLEGMEDWKWSEAEGRLSIAYEKGGFPLWAQMVVHELEAEARVERIKREKESVTKQGREVS